MTHRVSEFFDTVNLARYSMGRVASVADHLSALGIPAAKELYDAVDDLQHCVETFKRLDGEALNERVKDAKQSTANMLAVAIGMADLVTPKASPTNGDSQ